MQIRRRALPRTKAQLWMILVLIIFMGALIHFSILHLNNARLMIKAYDPFGAVSVTDGHLAYLYNGPRPSSELRQSHLVFESSCPKALEWQSFVFFYHAKKSGQPGTVTRVATGCSSGAKTVVRQYFQQHIQPLSDLFHLHFAPGQARIEKENVLYKHYNAPFGLQHWMDSVMGHRSRNQVAENDVVIIMEPDQILLRPFTGDFSRSTEVWYGNQSATQLNDLRVRHGSPFAQSYDLPPEWKESPPKLQMNDITHDPTSPANMLSPNHTDHFFRCGPPLIATARDTYRIIEKWAQFVPRVYDYHPELVGKMFVYSMAAVHLGLKHRLASSFVVSKVDKNDTEGWSMIDTMPLSKIYRLDGHNESPHAVRVAEDYRQGRYSFSSVEDLPRYLDLCEAPLLATPPANLANLTFYIEADQTNSIYVPSYLRKRRAFMLHSIISRLNEATRHFKKSCHEKYGLGGPSGTLMNRMTKLRPRRPRSSTDEPRYHVVFASTCSHELEWQSFVFFYHAMKSGQIGTVTWIAMGCSLNVKTNTSRFFAENIQPMSDRFYLYFSPNNSPLPKEDYRYKNFNRPFGLKQWMENFLGYSGVNESHVVDGDIVILTEPDQILLRPFTRDFSNSSELWYGERGNSTHSNGLRVQRGSVFTQSFERWDNLTEYISDIGQLLESSTMMLSKNEIEAGFRSGPPYISTARDMYRIVNEWAELTPTVYLEHPELIASPYVYSIAAARLGVRHHVARSFVRSQVEKNETEAWSMVDAMPKQGVCRPEGLKDTSHHTIQALQDYKLGRYYFHPEFLPPDFLTCESPLLAEPPENLAEVGYYIEVGQYARRVAQRNLRNRQAFMLCSLIEKINEAAIYYKDKSCTKGRSANFSKSIMFTKG